jgi:hypothetical protein
MENDRSHYPGPLIFGTFSVRCRLIDLSGRLENRIEIVSSGAARSTFSFSFARAERHVLCHVLFSLFSVQSITFSFGAK